MRDLPHIEILARKPIRTPSASQGWLPQAFLIWKKKCSIAPVVDFGLILGGEATTFESVSSIEVLEGLIGSPLIVMSQYLRF
jgi:hypothetical protein